MNATLASAAAVGSAPASRRLRNSTMASYGFGAAAYGVKDSGFGTFLLLFYNQVIGVPATCSITRYGRPSSVAPPSTSLAMWGCSSRARI